MKIPWKLKSAVFAAIDMFHATNLLYFLQKNITKRSRILNLNISENWQRHKRSLKKYNCTGHIFEFGAGKNLAQNLYLSDFVNSQLVVDLNPMIDLQLVETARELLKEKIDLKSDKVIGSVEDLLAYGITYKAPYDASNTDLDDKSLDACISTNTLEHIPKKSIFRIFNELHRVLKNEAIVSAQIDYSDHYSHTDPSISLLNYLRYTDKQWEKYNHRCHFQNRLRHCDYIEIFNACGFSVIEENIHYSEQEIPADIVAMNKGKSEDWAATSAHLILKKKAC